ncbi:MAG: prepilin-type N-terminal cleavage/methylation domain-containing protein [Anaerohalosphaeraceae bacterium]
MKMKKKKQSNGFTLIEALMAAMLLGLVVAALAAASGAFTMANGYGVDLSTAEFLIEQIREMTTSAIDPEDPDYLPFDSLVTDSRFDGTPFGPINARGEALPPEFSAFKQIVEIERVQSGNFNQPGPFDSPFVRVTVTVTKSGQPISSTRWIRANMDE